jgi:hypothetical protein
MSGGEDAPSFVECCGVCRFWSGLGVGEKDVTAGICQRHAPRPAILWEQQHRRVVYDTYPTWPRTMATEWCGEWEARR